jgi:glutamine synthetase
MRLSDEVVGRFAKAKGLSSRWEVRCMDGMANPYLALYAIFNTGITGVREAMPVTMKDCLSLSPLISITDTR